MKNWTKGLVLPVERCLLGCIQSQKACIGNCHYQLHFDILDAEQCLRAEEVLSAEGELVRAWCASDASPAAVCIVYS
jgi:hypothetical protein